MIFKKRKFLQTSRIELRVYSEIKYLFSQTEHQKKIDGWECDVFIPEIGLCIEVDGYYWHKDKYKIDQKKNIIFQKNGFDVLRIREKGLKKTSVKEVIYNDQDHMSAIEQVVNIVREKIKDDEQIKKIDDYLTSELPKNVKLYRTLLQCLPGALPGKRLIDFHPELLKEWHREKNKPLEFAWFSHHSNYKVWWKCKFGHVWNDTISHRSAGRGCPYCSGHRASKDYNLKVLHPSLIKEWNYNKNRIMPETLRPKSNQKVWWKCSKGHEWQASPNNRLSKRNCPVCSGRQVCKDNCLASLKPKIAKMWHSTKNGKLTPDDVTLGSGKKVWWKCKCGHEWQAYVKQVVLSENAKSNGCHKCEIKFLRGYSIEQIREFAQKRGGKCLSKKYINLQTKMLWVCENGHTWKSTFASTKKRENFCIYCHKKEK